MIKEIDLQTYLNNMYFLKIARPDNNLSELINNYKSGSSRDYKSNQENYDILVTQTSEGYKQ